MLFPLDFDFFKKLKPGYNVDQNYVLRKSKSALGGGGGVKDEGKDSSGVWNGHVHSAIKRIITLLKRITNMDLLYGTWNSAQCYVAAWMGEGFGGEWMHVYV